MGMRKIIQFGTNAKEGLVVFSPFEEEDEWQDGVNPALIPLTGLDGAFRSRGYGQSRKPEKTVTKRFMLYDDNLKRQVGNDGRYMSDFTDYVYRGLRGGVKKLFVVTESGEVRWTWAEAVQIPYSRSFGDAKNWRSFVVDFILHDPYWYKVQDQNMLFFDPDNVPLLDLVYNCIDIKTVRGGTPLGTINLDVQLLDMDECEYKGVILEDSNLAGYVGDICLTETLGACRVDPCYWGALGEGFIADGDITVEVCVRGSAGARRPFVTFRGSWVNPTLTNLENNFELAYTGVIAENEYLEIDLGSALNGEIADMTINTNIVGFDETDISISNDGFFELVNGVNDLFVEGGQGSTSVFTIKIIDKHHN